MKVFPPDGPCEMCYDVSGRLQRIEDSLNELTDAILHSSAQLGELKEVTPKTTDVILSVNQPEPE